MRMIEILKSRNRTLLEVYLGDLAWTLLATLAGIALPIDRWGMEKRVYFSGLWAASLLVALALLYMYRCLDRALDLDEKTATQMTYRGYLIRYTGLGVIAVVAALAGLLDPVVLCLSYLLLMKAAVYSQPFTHKLCNKMFHETDPEPEPLSDEEPEKAGQKI